MRIVDEAVFTRLEAAGLYVPALHADEDDPAPAPDGAVHIHDGLVTTDTTSNVVTYKLPYGAYYSSIGDDDGPRLTGRKRRRSVFFSITYVGEDRNQAKWAGEKIRAALQGKRLVITGHRTWLCSVEESQRVRRDDDAIRPDGSPLFYGVDNYSLPIMLTD